MTLNLITLDTVKTQLGISDATYDAAITSRIPLVSSDVRRILNTNFDCYTPASFNSGSNKIVFDLGTSNYYVDTPPPFALGQVVHNPNIPDDTYLTNYDPKTGKYTMSSSATGEDNYVYPTLTVAQWQAFSQMIWYKISTNTQSDATKRNVKSYSYGVVSKSFADSEINKQWNYPQTLIDDLGKPFMKVG